MRGKPVKIYRAVIIIIMIFLNDQFSLLTPTEQIIPHQVLLLSEHCHHDESVQIDPLTKHPKVVTAKQVEVDKLGHFTAYLEKHKNKHKKNITEAGRRKTLFRKES